MQLAGSVCAGTGLIVAAASPHWASVEIASLYAAAFLAVAAWPGADRRTLCAVAWLCAAGIATLQRIDPGLAATQAVWLLLAAVAYCLASVPDCAQAVRRYAAPLSVASVLLLAGGTFWGLASGGSRSWLLLVGVPMQPVEVVKVVLVLAWARLLARNRPPAEWYTVIGASVATLLLLLVQRDLGPAIVLALTALFGAITFGVPTRRIFRAGGVGALGLTSAALFFPHVSHRIAVWLDPWHDRFGAGYQAIQSRLALARGGVMGQGWPAERALFVPASATDLPLVAWFEAVGVAGALCLFAAYGWFLYRLLRLALGQDDAERVRYGTGLVLLVGAQTLLIVAGSLQVLPLAGVTLPLVSYGGSSLVVTWFVLGLMAPLRGSLAPGVVQPERSRAVAPGVPMLRRVAVGSAAILLGASAYWAVWQGPQVLARAGNSGPIAPIVAGHRGGITARNGESLSAVIGEGSAASRQAVWRSLAHVVGYVHPRFGAAGLEAAWNPVLLGDAGPGETGLRMPHRFRSRTPWTVQTSIDVEVQAVFENAFQGLPGAGVVLDPWTGQILAIVSSPSFEPAELSPGLAHSHDAPFFNRALQGRYPPGSAFKPVVLAAGLEFGAAHPGDVLNDTGRVAGHLLQNASGRSLGELTWQDALAHSSNVLFADLARQSGGVALRYQAQALGIGHPKPLEIPHAFGSLGALDTPAKLLEAGIGQGEVLVTPLEMAVVAASVANGGYRVHPHLVLALESASAQVRVVPPPPDRALSAGTAGVLAAAMRRTVEVGTAKGSIEPALLAGKTGSAENPFGPPHAWFMGFAPSAHPLFAFAILVEHGGSGARSAVPIAAEIARLAASRGVEAQGPTFRGYADL